MAAEIKRKRKGPLESIKNQNWIRKKFGEDGIRVYIKIKQPISFDVLLSSTGLTKEQLIDMLQLMEKQDIIEIKGKLEVPEQPEPVIEREEIEKLKKETKEKLKPKKPRELRKLEERPKEKPRKEIEIKPE